MKKIKYLLLVVIAYVLFTPNVLAAKKYTIKFNANGGIGTIKNVICTVNKKCTLTKNKFKKEGYTFTGWNTKKNGKGKTINNAASVKNLVKSGTITLYAQWKKTSYKITYNLNNGVNNKENPKKFTITTKTIKLKKPTRDGYTFDGWYSDKKFKNKVTKIKKGTTKNIVLYAKWTANKYTIKFDGNGATSGSMNSITCTYDKKCTLPVNKYQKSDYTFVYWNTKKDGTGKNYKDNQSVKNIAKKGTITLYAVYKQNYYTVKFDGNGSTSGITNNVICYYDKDCTLTDNKFSKLSYNYVKWNTKSDGTGISYNNKQTVKNITKNNEITLYAIWDETFTSTVDRINLNDNILYDYTGTGSMSCGSNSNGYRFIKNADTFFQNKDVRMRTSNGITTIEPITTSLESFEWDTEEYNQEHDRIWNEFYALWNQLEYDETKEQNALQAINKLNKPYYVDFHNGFNNHIFSFYASSINIFIPISLADLNDGYITDGLGKSLDLSTTPNFANFYGRTNNKFIKFANDFNTPVQTYIEKLNAVFNGAYYLVEEGGCGTTNAPELLNEEICEQYNLNCSRW